jgi:nicotinamide riboside transporter PnuC
MRNAHAKAPPKLKASKRDIMLALSILTPPAAWLLHLVASYALVGPSCGASAPGMIHASLSVLALLFTAPSGWFAWREWKAAQSDEANDRSALQRTRLFAAAGMANTFLFGTIIALSAAASLLLSPCTP